MKDTQSRELYSSPNGDRWHLCKDASGRVFVLHQANIPSGGQTSRSSALYLSLGSRSFTFHDRYRYPPFSAASLIACWTLFTRGSPNGLRLKGYRDELSSNQR